MAASIDDHGHDPQASTKSKPRNTLRVLCIDGGGIRGVATILALQKIQEKTKGKREPHQLFDLICGTSTGGILAIMLGILKMPLEDCLEEYKKLAKIIFPKGWFQNWRKPACDTLGKPWYDAKVLEDAANEMLRKYNLEGKTMSDTEVQAAADRPHVFVVSAQGLQPYLLRNYSNLTDGIAAGTDDKLLVDAIMATSAAPTFFAAREIDGASHTDGGMGHNNPILCADLETLRIKAFETYTSRFILSLGTGGQDVDAYKGGSGITLVKHITDVVTGTEWNDTYFDGRCKVSGCTRFFTDNTTYCRLNPKGYLNGIELDDADKFKKVCDSTRTYLGSNEGQKKVNKTVRNLGYADAADGSAGCSEQFRRQFNELIVPINQSIAALKAQVDELNQEKKKLEVNLQKRKETIKSLKLAKAELESKLNVESNENQQKEQRIDELKNLNDEKDKKIAELTARIEELESTTNIQRSAIECLRIAIETAEKECRISQADYNRKSEEAENLHRSLNDLLLKLTVSTDEDSINGDASSQQVENSEADAGPAT